MNTYEFQVLGNGKAGVVFLNGFRMHFDSWAKVYPQIARENRVLLFNRAGVGASAKAQVPQTGKVVVDGIRSLGSVADVKPPYVLVSHSIGGIFANLYARLFPSEVAGVVFVDAPHPLEIAEQKKIKPPLLLRALNERVKVVEKFFDPYKFSEDDSITETLRQIDDAGRFPNIPIAVLTGSKKMPFVPERSYELHMQFQQELLRLSGDSRHFLCEQSGHFPQITESEVVVNGIDYVLKTSWVANR